LYPIFAHNVAGKFPQSRPLQLRNALQITYVQDVYNNRVARRHARLDGCGLEQQRESVEPGQWALQQEAGFPPEYPEMECVTASASLHVLQSILFEKIFGSMNGAHHG
jgi:hypothetical protein